MVVEGWIEGWCTVHIIYLPPTLGNSRLPETDGRKFGLSAQLCLCLIDLSGISGCDGCHKSVIGDTPECHIKR